MVKVRRGTKARTRICQGDIFRDVDYIEHATERSGIVEVSRIRFPLVIVLTQDCDLEQDFRSRSPREPAATQDKLLLSVLVAPLYNVEHVYLGEHLSELGAKMEPIARQRTAGTYLRSNQRPRFHYLEFPHEVHIVPSVIDFKHYFSVNVRYLRKIRKANLVCTVSSLFREDICQRFSSFLSRIGLPEVRQG